MERHISAEPFPPGEYIQEFMEDRGWTQDDLAAVLGRSRQHINRLLQGKTGVTAESARELAEAFGTSAELWMNLQVSHELSIAAQADREIRRRALIFEKAPVREMVKRGWIADTKNTDALEREICSFWGTTSIDEDPCVPVVSAKKSTSYNIDTSAQIAWYRRAYRLAENIPASRYDASSHDDGIKELLTLAAYPEDARRIPHALAIMGVRLVLVEHLKGTKIDGVAFWLDDATPAIALSLRYDRIDNLWHTLMHELMHIKRRDKHPAVDVDIMSKHVSDTENEVNELAADALIPKRRLDSFISRKAPYYYKQHINRFAQRMRVHPGIVVGQLQWRDELKYWQLRGLLEKVRHYIIPSAITDGWGNTPSF